MVLQRFEALINYLATCNGTIKAELNQRVLEGELDKDDAQLIFYYASIKKLNNKLDNISKKVPKTILPS